MSTAATPPQWTPESLEALLYLWKKGRPASEIAEVLGFDKEDVKAKARTIFRVRTKHKSGSHKKLENPGNPARITCLKCRKEFNSPDKVRIRRCKFCSGGDDYGVYSTGGNGQVSSHRY